MTELLTTLEDRFTHTPEHYDTPAFRKHREGIAFAEVRTCLENDPALARKVYAMNKRGGQPDVWARAGKSFLFVESVKETCRASRNCVYDKNSADRLRKKYPGEQFDSVEEQRDKMGVEVVDESLWREMQRLGRFTGGTYEWLESSDVIYSSRTREAFRAGDHLFVHCGKGNMGRDTIRGWRAVAQGSKA